MTDPAQQPSTSYRWRVAASIIRSLVAVGALLLVYFMLPLDARSSVIPRLGVVVLAMSVFVAIFLRQLRRVRQADYPVLRAVEAIAVVATLFVVTMASVHFGIAETNADAYSEALNRMDSLYFTVTTLATVGFGDITPVSQTARVVTTLQMVMGVVLLGAGVRVLVAVAQAVTRERRGSKDH